MDAIVAAHRGDRNERQGVIVSESMPDEFSSGLVTHGRLAEALRKLAAQSGRNLGLMTVESGAVRVVFADRQVTVSIDSKEPWFVADFWHHDVCFAQGATSDLDMMAGAIDDWGKGWALLNLLPTRHGFRQASEMGTADERGDVVELMWLALREDPHDGVRLIAGAAAAEPRLRELFPYTSHQFLCFSRCTVYPYSMDLPVMVPLGGGRCRALGRDGSFLIADGSPAEAAAAVAAALPEDCGPAISGTMGWRTR